MYLFNDQNFNWPYLLNVILLFMAFKYSKCNRTSKFLNRPILVWHAKCLIKSLNKFRLHFNDDDKQINEIINLTQLFWIIKPIIEINR